MGKFRIGFRSLAALTLLGGLTQDVGLGPADGPARSSTTSRHSLELRSPRPPSSEVPQCTIELEKGKTLGDGKHATAWVVKDGQGRVLRKFHDTTGAGGVNIFAYFKDGDEVYREMLNDQRPSDRPVPLGRLVRQQVGRRPTATRRCRSTPGSPSRRRS